MYIIIIIIINISAYQKKPLKKSLINRHASCDIY